MVGVIDYKAGNAPSVGAALTAIGVDYIMVKDTSELEDVSHIILPGVGAARATMDSLNEMDLIDILTQKVLVEKIPFLGICIGLQVLFNQSEEGDVACLGWIDGHVVRFDKEKVRVPHMGWNGVQKKFDHFLLKDIEDMSNFYFVNSFHAVVSDDSYLLGETEYGILFPSIIVKENIMATQFHAEKSGKCGLQLLSNFCKETK